MNAGLWNLIAALWFLVSCFWLKKLLPANRDQKPATSNFNQSEINKKDAQKLKKTCKFWYEKKYCLLLWLGKSYTTSSC
jgi:hypothetical protein